MHLLGISLKKWGLLNLCFTDNIYGNLQILSIHKVGERYNRIKNNTQVTIGTSQYNKCTDLSIPDF